MAKLTEFLNAVLKTASMTDPCSFGCSVNDCEFSGSVACLS